MRSDKFAAKATPTDVVTITAELRRSIGQVSRGTRVLFEAMGQNNQPRGELQAPTIVDDQGKATVKYTAGDGSVPDTVVITARVECVANPCTGAAVTLLADTLHLVVITAP